MFGSASNSACKTILNMLKALNLSDGQTIVEGFTVIEREWTRAVAIVLAVVESRVCRMRKDRENGNDRR